jgi:type I restriction enzyme S subunit
MHDGWINTVFGEVVTPVHRTPPLDPDREYKQITLAINGKGARLRAMTLGRALGSARFEVRAGDLLLSKIDARKGAAAVVPEELDGAIVTADFPSFALNESLVEPRYLDLVVRRPSFARLTDSISGGTTNRVRMDLKRFPDLPIALPPRDEQLRIVDLATSTDNVIDRARSASEQADALLAALGTQFFLREAHATRALGDIVEMGSGPSFSASDACESTDDGAIRVLGIMNTAAGRDLDLSHTSYVRGLPSSTRILREGALLMIRTNGNRARIGNVYRVPSSAYGCAYSAFQIGIFPEEVADSEYIFWALRTPPVQRSISESASGTTGLGNVAVSWLKNLALPWPERLERERFVSTCDALAATARAARSLEAASRKVRAALVDELLSGDHEIPASYDALLEPVS